MKKIVLVLVVLCLLTGILLPSCKKDSPDTGSTTGGNDETEKYPYEITKLDGRDIVFLAPGTAWGVNLHLIDFVNSGDLTDQLDVDRYNKNRKVESVLGIKFEEYLTEDMFSMSRYYNDAVLSNLNTYDLAYVLMQHYNTVMNNSVNLLDVSTLHLEDEWWEQSFIDSMTVGDDVLYGTIDYNNLHSQVFTGGVYFNRDMAKEYKLGDLYDCVKAGAWTYDKMEECMEQVVNLNGDTAFLPPYRSGRSVYGCVGYHNETPLYLMQGSNRFLVEKDETGYPSVVDDLEPLYNVYQKLTGILSQDGYCMLINTEELVGGTIFWDGRALFLADSISGTVSAARTHELEYGVLPLPKYDEAQKNYVSPTSQYSLALMMPNTAKDIEIGGMVADYMNYCSYYEVYPTLLQSMCYKGLADETSMEIIDKYILSNHVTDIGYVNGWTQNLFEMLLTDMLKGEDRFTSLVASGVDVINNAADLVYKKK